MLRSLSLRIALLSACLSGGVLVVFGGTAWVALRQANLARLDSELRSQLFQTLVDPPASEMDWPLYETTLAHQLGQGYAINTLLWVGHPSGRQIYQSSHWPTSIDPETFNWPVIKGQLQASTHLVFYTPDAPELARGGGGGGGNGGNGGNGGGGGGGNGSNSGSGGNGNGGNNGNSGNGAGGTGNGTAGNGNGGAGTGNGSNGNGSSGNGAGNDNGTGSRNNNTNNSNGSNGSNRTNSGNSNNNGASTNDQSNTSNHPGSSEGNRNNTPGDTQSGEHTNNTNGNQTGRPDVSGISTGGPSQSEQNSQDSQGPSNSPYNQAPNASPEQNTSNPNSPSPTSTSNTAPPDTAPSETTTPSTPAPNPENRQPAPTPSAPVSTPPSSSPTSPDPTQNARPAPRPSTNTPAAESSFRSGSSTNSPNTGAGEAINNRRSIPQATPQATPRPIPPTRPATVTQTPTPTIPTPDNPDSTSADEILSSSEAEPVQESESLVDGVSLSTTSTNNPARFSNQITFLSSKGDQQPQPPPEERDRYQFQTLELDGQLWRIGHVYDPQMRLVLGVNLSSTEAQMVPMGRALLMALPIGLLLITGSSWVLASRALTPIRRLTGEVRGITAQGLDQRLTIANEDIELKPLMMVFNQMLERLERSFYQAKRFSSDAAHELKTPLTILQGEIEQSLQQAEIGSPLQQTFSHLLDETQRLKSIVRKLLLLSQADSGQMPLNRSMINLSQVTEDMAEDIDMLAPDLKVTTHVLPNVTIEADRTLTRQVLQNLISNAIKYNIPEGSIEIKVGETDTHVWFQTTNTAHPLSDSDQNQLFERFYRGQTQSQKIEGLGLGLSLCREIARAHQGDVTLIPTDGNQVCFRFSLPRLTSKGSAKNRVTTKGSPRGFRF